MIIVVFVSRGRTNAPSCLQVLLLSKNMPQPRNKTGRWSNAVLISRSTTPSSAVAQSKISLNFEQKTQDRRRQGFTWQLSSVMRSKSENCSRALSILHALSSSLPRKTCKIVRRGRKNAVGVSGRRKREGMLTGCGLTIRPKILFTLLRLFSREWMR